MPNTYTEACEAAYLKVFDDKSPTDWCTLGYEGRKLVPTGEGEGGLAELKEQFEDSAIAYALLRKEITDDGGDSRRIKFIMLVWCAPRPRAPRRPAAPAAPSGTRAGQHPSPPLLPATTTTEGWHGGGTGPGPRALPVIIGPPTLPPSGADRRPGTLLPHTGGCAGWARRRAPSRRGRSARTSRRWGPCSRATTSRSGCTSGRSWTGWRRRSTPSSRRPGGRTTTWATRGRARSGRGRGRTRTHPR